MSKKRHSRRWWEQQYWDFHHIPPRHPDRQPRFRGLRKPRNAHTAYHILFGNAKSREDAIAILIRDWWPEEESL